MVLQGKRTGIWKMMNRFMLFGMLVSIFAGAFFLDFERVFRSISDLFYAGFLVSTTALNQIKNKKKVILQWCVLLAVLIFIFFASRWNYRHMLIVRMWIVYGYYIFMQWLSGRRIKKNTVLLSISSLAVITLGKIISHPALTILLLLVQVGILLRIIDPILYQIAMNHRKKMQYITTTVVAVVIGVGLSAGMKVSLVQAADATKYYVSEKKGNDSNAGTSKSKALKTLKKAVQKSQDGDTIYLMDTQHIKENLTITKKITIGRSSEITGYIISVEDDAKLTLAGDVVVTGRKSTITSTRAMIIVKEFGTLVVKGNAVVKNNVTDDLNGAGGAVYNKGTFYLKENAQIFGNETKKAGGSAIHNEGEFMMSGGTIKNNVSSGEGLGKNVCVSGGGILDSGYMDITGGSITNNSSTSTGGGIFVGDGAELQMSGGTISNNYAAIHGGGVDVCSGNFFLSGGKITGNKAGESGGIHLTISESVSQRGYMEMTGGEISGNQAIGKDGAYGMAGGIFVNQQSTLYLRKGVIQNNTALTAAGGISVGGDCHVEIEKEVTISGNRCATCGGGILVRENGMLRVNGSSIINNSSESGGAIGNKGMADVNGIVMTGNSAKYGSGIYQKGTLGLAGEIRLQENNDVYLVKGYVVSLYGNLAIPTGKICLTPADYSLGRVCVDGSAISLSASDAMGWFILTKKDPYLLRQGGALNASAGISKYDIVLSRKYSVTYQKNSSREVGNMPDNGMAYWHESYTLASNVPTNHGHTFEGWNTNANGSGTKYQTGKKIEDVLSDIILYAIWQNEAPTLQTIDVYAVEDELETRVTKTFLLTAAKASDKEDGDLTDKVVILNWDSIKSRMQDTYTRLEKQQLCRKLEVKYKVEDSGGKTAESISTLIIFLIEEDMEDRPVRLRFISEKYIDSIRQDSIWNREEKKEYLRNLFQKDKSKIAWKMLE